MSIKEVLKHILPESLRRFLRKNFHFLHVAYFKYNVITYNRGIDKRIQRVRANGKVKIMFYVFNVAMWKSDKLVELLKTNNRFEVFIVPFLLETDTEQYNLSNNALIFKYFQDKNIEVRAGFDFEQKKQYSVDTFDADLIFYPQPYINDIDQLPHRALMAYIPYCYIMEDMPVFHNSLFQNICWRMYYPTQMHKEMEAKYAYNRANNVVVVGYPMADYFFDESEACDSMWKSTDRSYKRVIWAPHHSILADDTLDYSNFLEIAEGMLELANMYKDKLQFVFKPHPRLKAKLYQLPKWGEARTDAYYDAWANNSNCSMIEGNYVDLFKSSDCMIHDCSSFTGEYLYLNKPVMFVSEKESISQFNSFANECLKMHYRGYCIDDIKCFLDNVIHGYDPMLGQRTSFLDGVLKNNSSNSVSLTIYNDLCDTFLN